MWITGWLGASSALAAREANSILGCIRNSGQQVRGSDPALLLSPSEAISGVLCPVLDPQYKKD